MAIQLKSISSENSLMEGLFSAGSPELNIQRASEVYFAK